MTEQDEQYLEWLCRQAEIWRDVPETHEKYIFWIRDHVRFLRKLAEVGTTASRDELSINTN